MRYSFKDFLMRKNKKLIQPKEILLPKTLKRRRKHHLNMARGMDRQSLKQIPDVSTAKQTSTPRADRILKIAKNANRGIWKITQPQAVELANKYNFYIPDKLHQTKHLGTTGILMWRRKDGMFFLFKPDAKMQGMEKLKREMKKRAKGQRKKLTMKRLRRLKKKKYGLQPK